MKAIIKASVESLKQNMESSIKHLQDLLAQNPELAPLLELLLTEESSVITGTFGTFIGENSWNVLPSDHAEYLSFLKCFLSNEILEAAISGICYYSWDGDYNVVPAGVIPMGKDLDGKEYPLEVHPYVGIVACDSNVTTFENVMEVLVHHRTKRNEYLKSWDEPVGNDPEQMFRIRLAKSMGLARGRKYAERVI